MQRAGGVIGLVAGIFGVIAAIFTLIIGGIGTAVKANSASLTVGRGWGGIVFTFLVIILAAIALGAKSKLPGVLLIAASVAGAILGGTFVAVFMVLSLIGGILATIGTKKAQSKSLNATA